MRFSDYVKLAFKNLTRSKARTILTIIAIMVGSLSLILMASVIISIKQSLTDQFKQLGAFDLVTVVKDPNSVNSSSLIGSNGDPSEGKNMDDTTLAQARRLDHVIAATGVVNGIGVKTMKLEGQDKKTWASIVGFDPDSAVFNISTAFGRKLVATDTDKILVGNRFVQDMGYTSHPNDLVGKNVILTFQNGGNSAPDWGSPPPRPPMNADKSWWENQPSIEIPVEIVGITGSGAIDDGQSYVTLSWARHLMTNVQWEFPKCDKDSECGSTMQLTKTDNFLQQGYGSILLKVDDTKNIGTVAESVKKLGYGATTAQTMLDQINQILLLISIVLAVIGGISLFVATIGIINTMIMATYERTKEIGMMRACGATRATIRHLFTFEAALLGFFGGVFGIIISYGLVKIAKLLFTKYGASLGSLPLEHLGEFPWWLVIAVIIFTTLLGMMSGLIPAIRAARLNPVEALRYE
ncbi:MAG: FtsX-like permease family protein [Patescibacteria group bacterium]|jgi:putative ABC transport system permease protein